MESFTLRNKNNIVTVCVCSYSCPLSLGSFNRLQDTQEVCKNVLLWSRVARLCPDSTETPAGSSWPGSQLSPLPSEYPFTRLGGGGPGSEGFTEKYQWLARANHEKRTEGWVLQWQADLSCLQKTQSGAGRKERDERKQVGNRPGQSTEWEEMGTETRGGAWPAGQAWRVWEEASQWASFQPPAEQAGRGRAQTREKGLVVRRGGKYPDALRARILNKSSSRALRKRDSEGYGQSLSFQAGGEKFETVIACLGDEADNKVSNSE